MSHEHLYSDYSDVIVVGAGAVDYKLISICHKGDVVVSQDYGVAAMALGKAPIMVQLNHRRCQLCHISHIWRIRSMKHVSIFHRRTSVFLAEQLKEKAGILISDGKADIICGKCGAP